jgi:integrase/recombinase XerC
MEGGRRIQRAITAALDATDRDVRNVQKLSRHRKPDTLMIYDDNRGRDQQDITSFLMGCFEPSAGEADDST